MSKKPRNLFLTITDGKLKGVYEIDETIEHAPSNNIEGGNTCKCCQAAMKAAFDVMQLGFWDDSYSTYFCCPSCRKASVFKYTLSRIEAVKVRKQRKAKKNE